MQLLIATLRILCGLISSMKTATKLCRLPGQRVFCQPLCLLHPPPVLLVLGQVLDLDAHNRFHQALGVLLGSEQKYCMCVDLLTTPIHHWERQGFHIFPCKAC